MPSEAIDNLEWGTDEEWEALDASSPTAAELDIMAANIKKSGLASA